MWKNPESDWLCTVPSAPVVLHVIIADTLHILSTSRVAAAVATVSKTAVDPSFTLMTSGLASAFVENVPFAFNRSARPATSVFAGRVSVPTPDPVRVVSVPVLPTVAVAV